MNIKTTLSARLLFLSLFILQSVFCATTAMAQTDTPTPRLIVWLKSGERVSYELQDQPETTFEEGLLIIKTATVTVTYQLSNVLRYTYEDLYDSVDAPSQPGIVVAQKGGTLYLSNLKGGTPVRIYTTAGILLNTLTAQEGQTLEVSLAAQPAGIYIVKAADQTLKIRNK